MDQLREAMQVLFILGGYGGIGVASGVLMYRVLVTRGNAPGSETLGPAALMAGVFWPVGLFIGLAMFYTTPHLAVKDQREIRRRQNKALKSMQLLEVERMEFQADKARALLEVETDMFHRDRMRAINARTIDKDG